MTADGINRHWDLVITSARQASRQMALDEVLARAVWRGLRPPTLRLYRWHREAVTIGRHQHPAARQKVGAVRRMTGGRAIHHGDEMTLSLALPAGHPLIRPTIRATYLNICQPLHLALSRLGLGDTPPHDTTGTVKNHRDTFACFDQPAFGEAMHGHHKLMGLAQWLGPDGLLAQGSIPLGPPKGTINQQPLGIRDLNRQVTWETVATALIAAVSECFQVTLSHSPLSQAESRRASQLAHGRYRPLAG